jgi:alpha-L-fucosidase
MTMNDTWGYKSNDHNWKSGKDLILKLSDIVSKGGNFLLNVGPTSKGEIPQPSIERLKQIGAWMDVNHEAIYGTQASPFPYLPWGRATLKGQKLYLHVVSWPDDGYLKVPLKNKALSAWLLADPNSKLDLVQDENRIEIKVPDEAPDSILSVVVLQFEGDPETFPVSSAGKLGTASSVDSTTAVKNLFDGDPKNFWKPVPGETKAWVEVDLGEPLNIGSFTVVEPWHPWDNHGQEFTLQYKNGDKWVDIVSGKTNGCGHTQQFEPVTGRYFRLNIAGAKDGVPVLNEWVLNRAL